MEKTNPMRHLDRLGIPYIVHEYEHQPLGGMEVAVATGEDPEEVFKTLVTVGKPKQYHVFVVPVTGSLDLKKAAASVGEKSVSMIKQEELLPLTGYVHGGCSPLCIKRPMTITIDSTAQTKERIYFSAGRIGYQLEVRVSDLPRMMKFEFADIRKPSA
jgi:Cys-tRNA(Pro)/Cys-tRNA(Cys) deacylase